MNSTRERCFSIKLEPVLGISMGDCFRDGSEIAARIGFAYVSFRFNGKDCTAYPSGRGEVRSGDDSHITMEWDTSGSTALVREHLGLWTNEVEWMIEADFYAKKEQAFEEQRKKTQRAETSVQHETQNAEEV